MSTPEPRAPARATPRYGGYAGLLALLIIALITINTIVTKPNGVKGLAEGEPAPPFAVPLALGELTGDADTATRANQGAAGHVPACRERGSQILNICQLYEGAPVVLALFVDGGSCPDVLDDMQALAPGFPGVRFAAVALKGDRSKLRKLIRTHRLSIPIGIDNDGALAALYKVGTCPQLSFLYPGGAVQGRALLNGPSRPQLRRRIAQLIGGSRARGWRQSSR
jgi:hypothetical protein